MFAWFFRAFAWLFSGIQYLFSGLRSWVVVLIVYVLQHYLPKVLISLGVGFVTYNLGSYGLNEIYSAITGGFDGIPSDMLIMLKLAKVDDFLTITFGAYTARLTLQGITLNGSMKRVTFE